MANHELITVQELVRRCGIGEAHLEREVTSERFYEISLHCSEWKLLAPKLDITQAEVDDIESDHRKAELKKVSFLEKWQQKKSMKATYRVLVDSLLSIGRAHDARRVCEILSATLTPAVSSHQVIPVSVVATSPAHVISPAQPSITSPPATSSAALSHPPSAMPTVTVPSNRLEASGLEREIARLEKDFEELVDLIEESFIQNRVSLKRIQKSIKHIPVSLKLELGDYFRDEASKILNIKSIEELFIFLSHYWDYLNPGLLEFLVGRFGSDDDIALLQAYKDHLETFQASVKLGDFVHARHTESSSFNRYCYQKLITIMGRDWEKQTLQEADSFKKEVAIEHRMQPLLARFSVRVSSIAIVFCLPHWIEVEMDELEPLLARRNVVKVFLGDICLIDWTNQHTLTRSTAKELHKTVLGYRLALIKTQALSVSENVTAKKLSDVWTETTTEENLTDITTVTLLESTYAKLSELTTRLKNWKRLLDCCNDLDKSESKIKYHEWIFRHIEVIKEDQDHILCLVKQTIHLCRNLHHSRYSKFFPSGTSVLCSTARDRSDVELRQKKVLEHKERMPRDSLVMARLRNKRWKQLSSDWVDQLEKFKKKIDSYKKKAETLKSVESTRMVSSRRMDSEKLKVDFDRATKLVHVLSYIENDLVRVERTCMQEERELSLDKKSSGTRTGVEIDRNCDDVDWMESQDLIVDLHRVTWEQIRTLCYLPMVLIKKERGRLSYNDYSKHKDFNKVRCYLNEQVKVIGAMKNETALHV